MHSPRWHQRACPSCGRRDGLRGIIIKMSHVLFTWRGVIPRTGPKTKSVRRARYREIGELVIHNDARVGAHDVTSPDIVDLYSQYTC